MTRKKLEEVSKSTGADIVYLASKTGLSPIPHAGGPAAEIFAAILAPPVSRRRDVWFQEVADDLDRLKTQMAGFSLEQLGQNEEFVSAILQATQVTIRSHSAEKREALRNAVLNVAAGSAPDADIQALFITLIDDLTPGHLRLLAFLADPEVYAANKGRPLVDLIMGGISSHIESTFPEWRSQRELYDLYGKTLYARGLITVESFHTTMTGPGTKQKRSTQLGDRFIAFITSPIHQDDII